MHLAILTASLLMSTISIGQTAPTDTDKESKEEHSYNYLDDLNRDTPRGSLEGFLRATEENDYETAAKYLDLRGIPKKLRDEKGPQLAKKIKFVIDRALDIDEMSLSDDVKGVSKDGLAKTRDLLGQIEINKRKYTMYLDRMWGPKV